MVFSYAIERVLVADAVDAACVDLLERNGIQVDCKYGLKGDELCKVIKDYDGLVVRSDTKATAEVIAAGERLKVIGRAGAGVDNIDIPAATAKKVIVLNTPGGNAISACELTCSLITCLARNVHAGCASLKAGRWDRKLYAGHELHGRTLAVVGLGRIGREVAARMRAWGMRTIGYDPLVTRDQAAEFGVEAMTLEELWPQADYVTVHTPLIAQTRGLLNDAVFARCKPGVRVVNVARGGIVDEAALLRALEAGACGGAALDVYEREPPTDATTLALIAHPRVIATPHLGASTAEAQTRVAVEVAEQFVALTGRNADYKSAYGIVNRDALVPSITRLPSFNGM